MNHIHLASDSGFEADATTTDDGRVDLSIEAGTLETLLDATPPTPTPTPTTGLKDDAPPALNIAVQVVGSRGDVQPFVALGRALQRHGHRVRVVTHAVFRDLVTDAGLAFCDIGSGDPAELMAFMTRDDQQGLVPPPETFRNGELATRRRFIERVLDGCWASVTDPAFSVDAIIANPPSFAHVHLAETLGVPLHMMFTMPWTPTQAFPHPLANLSAACSASRAARFASYTLVECLTWQGLGDVINRFRTDKLGLRPLSAPMAIAPFRSGGLLGRLGVPTTYCWSNALLPKPADWGADVTVAGYFFEHPSDPNSNYTPSADLDAFLRAGPPPVYIGFGSIVVRDAAALTEAVLGSLRVLRDKGKPVRAILARGWAGLDHGPRSADVYFLDQDCPHEWLFPRTACVVHHGGAGTTAAGLYAGRPTVIVPFFGDQPFWGSLVARAGAGPEPVPFKGLTADALAAAIETALLPSAQRRAQALSVALRQGSGTETALHAFHQHLPRLACDVLPQRVAVWQCTGPGGHTVQLSALAAAVLVRDGRLAVETLQLLRAQETPVYTDSQPTDPVTGAGAAIVGDLTSIAMAVADFPAFGTDGDGIQDTAVQASQSIGRIVATGLQAPRNFCSGVAVGFHNAPRLYNDETVRAQETVTGLGSGLRAASRAFGQGLYDGITGLVTQPLRAHSERQGVLGGLAKGIGGVVLKPAAGAWAVPAYALAGAQAEVERLAGSWAQHTRDRVEALRRDARIRQGDVELEASDGSEGVLDKWAANYEGM